MRMDRLFLWFCCLVVLAGCAPGVVDGDRPVFTGTPSPPAKQNLPIIVNHSTGTPSPTHTITPTPTMTSTPDPTVLPDLNIPYQWIVAYDDPCPWGSPGTVTLLVRNIGNDEAGPFVAMVLGDETAYGGLPAGEDADLETTFQNGPLGSIYSAVDVDNQVVEKDETNNEMMIVFTPPPPCGTPPR